MSAARVRAALLAAIPDAEQGATLTLDNMSVLIDVVATEVVHQIREGEQ